MAFNTVKVIVPDKKTASPRQHITIGRDSCNKIVVTK